MISSWRPSSTASRWNRGRRPNRGAKAAKVKVPANAGRKYFSLHHISKIKAIGNITFPRRFISRYNQIEIRKYGQHASTIEHIGSTYTWEDLCTTERLLILQLGTLAPARYNMTSGGKGLQPD